MYFNSTTFRQNFQDPNPEQYKNTLVYTPQGPDPDISVSKDYHPSVYIKV